LHPGLQRTGVDGQSIPSNNVRFKLVSLPKTAGRIACAFSVRDHPLEEPITQKPVQGLLGNQFGQQTK